MLNNSLNSMVCGSRLHLNNINTDNGIEISWSMDAHSQTYSTTADWYHSIHWREQCVLWTRIEILQSLIPKTRINCDVLITANHIATTLIHSQSTHRLMKTSCMYRSWSNERHLYFAIIFVRQTVIVICRFKPQWLTPFSTN